jgi:membrane protein DedA with SNARE-associated domain
MWIPENPANDPWIDVYLGGKRYGYNFIEKRWAYSNRPRGGKEIEKWIDKRLST